MKSPRSIVEPDGSRRRPRAAVVTAAVLAFSSACSGMTARAQAPYAPVRELANPAAPGPTEFLEAVWPGYPEWLAMLSEILAGNQFRSGTGWFKKGVAQSRFRWETVRDRFDRDHDGSIVRDEYPGSARDFDRLDRDHDGKLTGGDIGILPQNSTTARLALEYSISAFCSTDRNGDGKVSGTDVHRLLLGFGVPTGVDRILASVSDELRHRLESARREGNDFLALADFQEAFDSAARRQTLPEAPPGAMMRRMIVPKDRLLRGFLRRELGAWGPGPALNSPAPDFTLQTSDGRAEVTLSKLLETKPVVLIFGNFTCGVLRSHVGSLEVLHTRQKDRAHFVMVYTREAHPVGGWELEENQVARVVLQQPQDFEQRTEVARSCRRAFGIDIPVLVDTMDDAVGNAYSGMPIRLYLIDRQGKVAYKGGRGPYGFKTAELEESLILLQSMSSAPPSPAR
jgi:hypothetical protein